MQATLTYRLVPGWEQLPAGYTHRDVVGVAVDAADRVYMLTRFEPQVLIYEPDGRFVGSFGAGMFTPRTHGLTIGPDGSIFCVDDGDHTVRKFSPDGKLLMMIGTPGVASDTGYDGKTIASISRGAPPFNRPTNVAVAENGDLYVADGYGNCRVHRFTADGKLLQSWGEPGTGPGQFHLPHGVCVAPDGRIWVCDRENDRVQIFSPEGQYISEWTQVQRPTALRMDSAGLIYVSELWWRPGQESFRLGPITEDRFGRVSVFNPDGSLIARIGGEGDPTAPGNFAAPHDMCVDSKGDMYVGEVTYTYVGRAGIVPEDTHTFQKFERV